MRSARFQPETSLRRAGRPTQTGACLRAMFVVGLLLTALSCDNSRRYYTTAPAPVEDSCKVQEPECRERCKCDRCCKKNNNCGRRCKRGCDGG